MAVKPGYELTGGGSALKPLTGRRLLVVFSADDSKKLVIVWETYLSAPGRSC